MISVFIFRYFFFWSHFLFLYKISSVSNNYLTEKKSKVNKIFFFKFMYLRNMHFAGYLNDIFFLSSWYAWSGRSEQGVCTLSYFVILLIFFSRRKHYALLLDVSSSVGSLLAWCRLDRAMSHFPYISECLPVTISWTLGISFSEASFI